MIVAALYVDPRGPYPRLNNREFAQRSRAISGLSNSWDGLRVDCWDEARDARLYDGPHPVVAHPPCRNWSRVSYLAKGDDSDCALRAVEQVRTFGGVLEHPAGSKLWGNGDERGEGGLLPPVSCRDTHGGYTIEVQQVEWGHACRKRTWLYLVGVPRSVIEEPPFPGRAPTHWCSGGRTGGSRKGSPIPPGIKAASGQIKRRTPPLFAEYLVRLARAAGEARMVDSVRDTENLATLAAGARGSR